MTFCSKIGVLSWTEKYSRTKFQDFPGCKPRNIHLTPKAVSLTAKYKHLL